MKWLLQPFIPCLMSCSGKRHFMYLTKIDSGGMQTPLAYNKIVYGLYLNELIIKLVHEGDVCSNIFNAYDDSLTQLRKNDDIEFILRIFEKKLLKEIGYGVDFTKEYKCGTTIEECKDYKLDPENGFYHDNNLKSKRTYSGANIIAIGRNQFTNKEIYRDAKEIMRIVISHKLRNKKIVSRNLLRKIST